MQRHPVVSYFGLFDGHGSDIVSKDLEDNFHNFVFDQNVFNNPVSSILDGFNKFDRIINEKLSNTTKNIETGGSCALIAMLIGKTNLT